LGRPVEHAIEMNPRVAAARVDPVPRPIVIDARAACRPELGGVERWAREMALRLPGLRPGAYTVAEPPHALVHAAGHAWEQAVLPARAALARASLIYAPANLAPLLWPRNVVVVHDAAALRRPEWYSRRYAAWQRRVMPAIVRRARHVVTVSEFSRRELIELLGANPGRTSVIAGGVDERFVAGIDPEPARRALRLERPYVLAVASGGARKNLSALGVAATRLSAEGIDLVVVGGTRPQFRSEEQVKGVRAVGHVRDDLLPALYAGARAFVLPSLYEGFGLTCIEAMATGVPVAAADRAALPETCAGAALMFDPEDPSAVADAVVQAATDEAARRQLAQAGRERAQGFTWERAARETDALLSRVGSADLA
jgi:glycosyltransferase involved in cell wall biosynthesis